MRSTPAIVKTVLNYVCAYLFFTLLFLLGLALYIRSVEPSISKSLTIYDPLHSNVRSPCIDEYIRELMIQQTGWTKDKYDEQKSFLSHEYIVNLLTAYQAQLDLCISRVTELQHRVTRLRELSGCTDLH